MVTFNLPSQLAGMADGKRTLAVEAATLGEAFERLDECAPMLRSQVFDRAGGLRQFVGLFVDNRQLLALGAGEQPLAEGSRVDIVMAVAGG